MFLLCSERKRLTGCLPCNQPPPVKPSSRSLGGLESCSIRSNGASSASQQEKAQVEDANRKQAAWANARPAMRQSFVSFTQYRATVR